MTAEDSATAEGNADERTPAQWAGRGQTATALLWVDPDALATPAAPVETGTNRTSRRSMDLLAGQPMRSGIRGPLLTMGALVLSYAVATAVWPLDAVAPAVTATQIDTPAAAEAQMTWPENGSAAVGVIGAQTAMSTQRSESIASLSKVISVLMVLEKLPLAVGEQGPSYNFTWEDSNEYWQYRIEDQSSLDVPVDGTLTEYQMLQGILLGSANNYIDRLADEIWGGRDEFAEAAKVWLADKGITGVELPSPSGFDNSNVASPGAMVQVAELAMQNPVFAEIVGTKEVELPGAGLVENSNPLMGDPGIVGIKTGTLDTWNLLTAKDVTVGEDTVRIIAAVLGQESDDDRVEVTKQVLSEVEAALQQTPVSITKGETVGRITTAWSDPIDIVATADVQVPLWNGATVTATPTFALEDHRTAGDKVGTLEVSAMNTRKEVPVALKEDVPSPSIFWRWTHPLQLFGISQSK